MAKSGAGSLLTDGTGCNRGHSGCSVRAKGFGSLMMRARHVNNWLLGLGSFSQHQDHARPSRPGVLCASPDYSVRCLATWGLSSVFLLAQAGWISVCSLHARVATS